jgi:hypothetical protein
MSAAIKTDQLGKAKLEEYFSLHGWLFRDQPVHDFGIDAHVEIVEGQKATGKIIAIQIKSGMSYFKERSKGAYVFRTDRRHVEYWINHSLPVIVVLYNPEKDKLYWEHVSKNTIKRTGARWRINIPKSKYLTDKSIIRLRKLIQPPLYIRRLNKLRLSRAWIDLVDQGEKVYVEFEDWVNKSLPRFQFRIGCDGRADVVKREWPMRYAPGLSFEELLCDLFPWADFETDEDAYQEDQENRWRADNLTWYDNETGEEHYLEPVPASFDSPEGIVPVSSTGETENYRVILSLNALGKAFILLDNHLSDEDDLEERTFTLEG